MKSINLLIKDYIMKKLLFFSLLIRLAQGAEIPLSGPRMPIEQERVSHLEEQDAHALEQPLQSQETYYIPTTSLDDYHAPHECPTGMIDTKTGLPCSFCLVFTDTSHCALPTGQQSSITFPSLQVLQQHAERPSNLWFEQDDAILTSTKAWQFLSQCRQEGEKFHCPFSSCKKILFEQLMLMHLLKHTNERPFICPVDGCRKSCMTLAKLSEHRQKSHSLTSPQKRTSRLTQKRNTLHASSMKQKNSQDAPVQKVYTCLVPGCAATFTRSSSFSSHRRTHSSERPFACRVCNVSFKQSGHLTQHLKSRMHMQKQKDVDAGIIQPNPTLQSPKTLFFCEECPKSYKYKCDLKRHVAQKHASALFKDEVSKRAFHDTACDLPCDTASSDQASQEIEDDTLLFDEPSSAKRVHIDQESDTIPALFLPAYDETYATDF